MAEAKRAQGSAESELIKLMGAAEADAMMKKANSWQNFNQAAILEMFFNILPGLAREISEPLSKVDKIVMVNNGDKGGIGASKITGEVASILAQLPTVVESLSGVDLKKYFDNLPGKLDTKEDVTESNPQTPND